MSNSEDMFSCKVVFFLSCNPMQLDKSKTHSQNIWIKYTPYQVIQAESFSLIPQVVSATFFKPHK